MRKPAPLVVLGIIALSVFSCSFAGMNGSVIPAATYRSVSESGGYSYRTEVTIGEGCMRYEHFEADVSTCWYEARFDTLAELGLNTFEAKLTKLESSLSSVSLNTGVAQLRMTYNSPILTVSIDGNGSGSFTDSSVDISTRDFSK